MSGATTLEKHNNAKMEAAIELVYSTTVGANDENGKFKYEYSQFARPFFPAAARIRC